jgi:hypothetical protein
MSGQNKRCWRCGAEFLCSAEGDAAHCWCEALPRISSIADGSDCLCAICLARVAREEARRPASEAQSGGGDQVVGHSAVLVEGNDYYHDGAAIVFTAGYHLRRGFCCGSGCRHCPYRAGEKAR